MNIDDRRPTDLRAHSHILGKFRMAIVLQRVKRSPSCLVLGWGFRGRRIERRRFRLDQIQDGGRRPSWKTSSGHISATRHPIHCMGKVWSVCIHTVCMHTDHTLPSVSNTHLYFAKRQQQKTIKPKTNKSIMMETWNLFHMGASSPADLWYRERTKMQILRSSRGNNARGIYIRLITI